jgi:hypothetical protein
MPVDEAIDEAAASAQMLADEATNVLVELGGELGGTLTVRAPKSRSTRRMATLRTQLLSSSLGGKLVGDLTKGG